MGYSDNDRHVRGDLFTDTGKWKYTVVLDYGWVTSDDYAHWDLWENARRALAHATVKGISGVSIRELGDYYTMVVLEPYGLNSHPIMVKGKDNA